MEQVIEFNAANFGGRDAGSVINKAIREFRLAEGDTLTVKLGAGTFVLDESIKIARDNVRLIGAGTDKTILKTTASKGNAEAVVVDGSLSDSFTKLKANAALDATKFTLESVRGIEVGTVIKIEEPNTDAYFKETGNTHLNATAENAEGNFLREMLAEVTAVDARTNTITIKSKAPYAFDTTAQVSIPELRKGIEIAGFKVTTDLKGTPDPYNFQTNPYSAFDTPNEGNAAVRVFAAEGLLMHDITMRNVGSKAFAFSHLYGSTLSDLDVDGAFNKGEGGNGYAFNLSTGFNNVFENLTDKNMRDSVIVGSFSAEHYNYFHILSTNRSVNFHGSPDSRNTLLIDKMILDFGPVTSDPVLGVGNVKEHPKSTIEDNDIKFKFVWGGDRRDIVHAVDSGAEMRTFDGDDALYGGKGADILDPGGDADVMTGAGGSDTFVYRRGSRQDVITDLQVGRGGDVIDLSGTGVTSKAGLSARKIGSDMVLDLGGGDTLVLQGIDAREYAQANFKWSAPALKGVVIEGIGVGTGYSGTDRADTFSLLTSYLDQPLDFLGMKGLDTLKFTAGATFDSTVIGRALGIDVVDMSMSKSKTKVTIDKAFADQADAKSVTVKFNEKGLFLATEGVTNWDAVKVSGTGEIKVSVTGATFSSAGGAIKVAGGNGDDQIKGAAKVDTIDGGRGNDRIMGGGGADKLWGGAGNDVFVFAATADSKAVRGSWDVVNDFNAKFDKFDLSLIDADAQMAGDQALRWVTTFTKAKAGLPDGQVKLVFSGGDTFVHVDQNGDNKADMIVQLDDVTKLTKDVFSL